MASIRRKVNRYILHRKLREKPPASSKVYRHIGILFNGTNPAIRDRIILFAHRKLEKEDIRIELLAYLPGKTDHSEVPCMAFNDKEINLAFVPKCADVDEFLGYKFEKLVNLDTDFHPSLNYIASLTDARLKIGPAHESEVNYDINIELKPDWTPMDLLRHIERTLLQLSSKSQ